MTNSRGLALVALAIVLMHLSVEGAVPTIHNDVPSTDDLVPEDPGAFHREEPAAEEGLVQDPSQSEKQQKQRSHTLNRWLDVKREQKKQAALKDLNAPSPTPTPPPAPPPAPGPAPSAHGWDMPDPIFPPATQPPSTSWQPWRVPGDFTNYDEISATRACNNWLRTAANVCQQVTAAAEDCTQRQLAATARARRMVSSPCIQARQECAGTLEWCRVEPDSFTCDRAGDSCGRVAPLCKHARVDLRSSLARCIPAQKFRALKCGEHYAKAYSACWHAYDALEHKKAPDMEALEEEVAVHRCGQAFAHSTVGCEHRQQYFSVVSQRSTPSRTEELRHQRDASCVDVHRAGQQQCSAAWGQVDKHGQDRDAKARAHAHAMAVFWPASRPPTAEAMPPRRSLPPTLNDQTAPQPMLNEQTAPVQDTGMPQMPRVEIPSGGPGGDLSQLLKATADIQQQVQETTVQPTEVLTQELDDGPVLTSEKSRVHPSVFNSSADLSDGVFSRIDYEEAARKAAVTAQKKQLAAKKKQLLAAQNSKGNLVDPAEQGEAAYHEMHPLTVAMQTCRANQKTAAVRCLEQGRGSCHNTWVGAYMSCFHTFAQAKSWLQRNGRLPKTRPKQKAPSVQLPPEVQRTAQLACARAYSKFSQVCSEAHKRSGSLCRSFATRGGVSITDQARARCGANHRQAQTVCAHARTVGRAKCETAWSTAKEIVVQQHGSPTMGAVVKPLNTRLERAQSDTMAHVQAAARQLQAARRTGMVKRNGAAQEKTLLLELMGAHGVGLALHGAQQHEQLNEVLLQL